MDPLHDPRYNMVQIIKESLLLEDHLAEPKKQCKDCIIKHLLKIIALQEEAVSLAGRNIDKYPLLKNNSLLYPALFEILQRSFTKKTYSILAQEIRERRKQLTKVYVTA